MNIYLSLTLLAVLSSCSTTRPTLRTSQAAQDTFKKESFLRYSSQRLNQFKNTPYRGLAQCHQGNPKKGLDTLKKKAFIQQNKPSYWNQVGMCYFMYKDYKKAAFYFNWAIKRSRPRRPYVPAINNLGVISLHLKHHQQALNYFKRAKKYSRSFSVPLFNLSQVYLKFHLLGPAQKILKKLYRKNKKDVEVIYSLGSLYLLKGNLSKAHQLWESIPKNRRNRQDIALIRSLTLYQQKKYQQALSLLEEQNFEKFLSMKKSALKLQKLLEIRLKEKIITKG